MTVTNHPLHLACREHAAAPGTPCFKSTSDRPLAEDDTYCVDRTWLARFLTYAEVDLERLPGTVTAHTTQALGGAFEVVPNHLDGEPAHPLGIRLHDSGGMDVVAGFTGSWEPVPTSFLRTGMHVPDVGAYWARYLVQALVPTWCAPAIYDPEVGVTLTDRTRTAWSALAQVVVSHRRYGWDKVSYLNLALKRLVPGWELPNPLSPLITVTGDRYPLLSVAGYAEPFPGAWHYGKLSADLTERGLEGVWPTLAVDPFAP